MALRFRLRKLNKKAVFFTFVACVFLSLLIFSSSIGKNYDMREESFVMETRIATMSMFVEDVEEDIERAAYIAGFRSVVALVDNIISTGEYISDVNSSFRELFFNGTIEGSNSSLLVNNTFNHWINKIKQEADKINLDVNFTTESLNIYQDNPWNIKIDLDMGIKVSDDEDISSWSRDKTVSSYIELEGFEDPFYVLGTNGLVENRVERTTWRNFTDGSDISNLLNHTYEGYYVNFAGAPSYLMRLEGDFGESEYGIESLVDIDELSSKGVSTKDKTIVDYIYFSSDDPANYHVSGAPSWFKLDNTTNMHGNQSHLVLYEVEELT
ncbi:hypothetical protein GF361_04385 [Candidatus Woesearchaeota archaeon]|nr:hypothetical protein [Candidatus Woesearchaeota archaeon]